MQPCIKPTYWSVHWPIVLLITLPQGNEFALGNLRKPVHPFPMPFRENDAPDGSNWRTLGADRAWIMERLVWNILSFRKSYFTFSCNLLWINDSFESFESGRWRCSQWRHPVFLFGCSSLYHVSRKNVTGVIIQKHFSRKTRSRIVSRWVWSSEWSLCASEPREGKKCWSKVQKMQYEN